MIDENVNFQTVLHEYFHVISELNFFFVFATNRSIFFMYSNGELKTMERNKNRTLTFLSSKCQYHYEFFK